MSRLLGGVDIGEDLKIRRIGIMGPGDMGQAVAQQLQQAGFEVCSALAQRSARSRRLAAEIGLTDFGTLGELVRQCDLLLSIMSPAAALEFAGEVADVLKQDPRRLLFVDCNPVAPQTMLTIDRQITAAGGRCVDAGIFGPPPRGGAQTWLYVSGDHARELEQLATAKIAVRVLSSRIGDASALKICWGALNKGTTALVLELLIAARRLGVDAALESQLREVSSPIYENVIGGRALMLTPPMAHRWAPEMREIAQTFAAVGMTSRIFEGAADMYDLVAGSELGKETPETLDRTRSAREIVRLLADEDRTVK